MNYRIGRCYCKRDLSPRRDEEFEQDAASIRLPDTPREPIG